MAECTPSSSSPKRTKSFFVEVQGVLEPWNSNVSDVLFAIMYRPYPGDVFVTSYPCAGDVWLSMLLYALTHDGTPPADYAQLSGDVLFLEKLGRKVEAVAPPRRLRTHLPAKKLRLSRAAKYVYVVRNYRDCCLSLYDHMTSRASDYRFKDATFEEYFECFLKGQVEDNDYFDHLASWWEHEGSQNFFFVLLENLKRNFDKVLVQLGEFLGGAAERLVHDAQRLKELRALCTYDCAAAEEGSAKGGSAKVEHRQPPAEYLRDGSCYLNCLRCRRHWKAKLNDEQAERLDKRFQERTAGTPIEHIFTTLPADDSTRQHPKRQLSAVGRIASFRDIHSIST
ncbi:sulfotransferase ssu-1-like [Haemaphysalis longicornis]|uniref:Sulfotransferase domain-containing protein n=1 Tax=Haemaphysalis longicornis TaxID=44386 RepID=A0A9J6G6R7_HAELO|nr:hypothetical protein HPB48_020394 [Haemaphysalis longicornis]